LLFSAHVRSPSQSLACVQVPPAATFAAHAPHDNPAGLLHRPLVHCAPSPQGAPSASCPAGVLQASGVVKTVSQVAELYAVAQPLTYEGVTPVDGASMDFTHWLFCRAMQSFASLYTSWTTIGEHSCNLLQIAFTSSSHAPSGVDAPVPVLDELHATSQIASPQPATVIDCRIIRREYYDTSA
jgi:hypothetical protein